MLVHTRPLANLLYKAPEKNHAKPWRTGRLAPRNSAHRRDDFRRGSILQKIAADAETNCLKKAFFIFVHTEKNDLSLGSTLVESFDEIPSVCSVGRIQQQHVTRRRGQMSVRGLVVLARSDNGDSWLFLEQTHQRFTEEAILHRQANAYRRLRALVNVCLLQERIFKIKPFALIKNEILRTAAHIPSTRILMYLPHFQLLTHDRPFPKTAIKNPNLPVRSASGNSSPAATRTKVLRPRPRRLSQRVRLDSRILPMRRPRPLLKPFAPKKLRGNSMPMLPPARQAQPDPSRG